MYLTCCCWRRCSCFCFCCYCSLLCFFVFTPDDYAEIIKHKTSERRVLVAIGGDTPEQAKAFALSAVNPNGRERLIDSIYDFVEEYEFDGIVLHWQFPNGKDEIDNYFGLIEVKFSPIS